MSLEINGRQALGLLASSSLVACGGSSLPATNPALPTTPTTPAIPATPTVPQRFLNAKEYRALEALVDQLIPADTDPGAKAAGCADGIDYLLGAFLVNPPFIHAGGPHSDRRGGKSNDFLSFLPLDDYETLAWRMTLEGSQGRPEREFNGASVGWQSIYQKGLARLDALAAQQGAADFAALTPPQRDAVLRQGDALVNALIDLAFPQTLMLMYGAPEYGSNKNLMGWGFTAFDGDVQPKGYTDKQVTDNDRPQPTDALLPASYHNPNQRQKSLLSRVKTYPVWMRRCWPSPRPSMP